MKLLKHKMGIVRSISVLFAGMFLALFIGFGHTTYAQDADKKLITVYDRNTQS